MSNILNNDEIRLSGLIDESIVDGPGIRFVIFTQGCPKSCFMCHNASTQPLCGGYIEKLDNIVDKWKKNPLLSGITISGGEPFIQPKAVLYLLRKAKESKLDVLIYSGFYYKELRSMRNLDVQSILDEADYLIDGPFEFEKKNLDLLFRGSSNQKIIDLKLTKEANEIVEISNFE